MVRRSWPFLLCLITFFMMVASWSETSSPPTSADYYKAGLTLYNNANYAGSIPYFKAAIKLDPGNWQAYQSLGQAHYQLHRVPEAVAAYDQALALHEDPQVRSFVDSIRSSSLPAPLGLPGADLSLEAPKAVTNEKDALKQFNEGKALQERAREALKDLASGSTLSREGNNIAKFGAPRFSKDDRRFKIAFQLGSPCLGGLDIGYGIEPLVDIGVGFLSFPTYDRDFFSVEPHIKFYSSTSEISGFIGAGFVFGSVSDYHYSYSSYPDYGGVSWFGPDFKAGFSFIDNAGLYFEMDISVGFVIANTRVLYETYDYGTGLYTYTVKDDGLVVPAAIPGYRLGFAF